MKFSAVVLVFGYLLLQCNFAHAQMGFHSVTSNADRESYASSNFENYSGRGIACARDAIVAALEHSLPKVNYKWETIHLETGLFQGNDDLLAPKAGGFEIHFTVGLQRTNSSKDQSIHSATGSAKVYYANKVDSAYQGSYCIIFYSGTSKEYIPNFILNFDETGAEVLQ